MHELARAYGWTEPDVFALTLERRFAYRLLLDQEVDAALLADLGAGEPR